MSVDKKKIRKKIGIAAFGICTVFAGMSFLARRSKSDSIYRDQPEQKNPFQGKKVIFVEDENDKENADGVKGHLEETGDSQYQSGFYDRYVKRWFDVTLSFCGLVLLSPVYAAIGIAIKIDDPGPILFTQKRVGKNKEYFKLHKFRTMKMSAPHDIPTHMLDNPDQYITKSGKFLRAHSLDELPQIWDIFVGNMSVVGPRPGLWNQDLLTAERDRYGANNVKPGLTGWAQINGRDELKISDKAKLDGEYTRKLGLLMDIKCFLGSVHVFREDPSVVEGSAGMRKAGRHYTDGKSDGDLTGHIGFGEPAEVDMNACRKVLIVGQGSYIGESFKTYAAEYYSSNFTIEDIDSTGGIWREWDFSDYDIVYHVAGIAHADVGNVDEDTKEKYYAVNTDLAIEVARKAKEEGVKEFIFMSSMIVYGDSAPYGKKKVVEASTIPRPANFYEDSKLQADVGVRGLADENFTVIVLRPPMIYGTGSKGNFSVLCELAKKLSVFPDVDNERSLLYIDNFCEFLCQVMLVKGFREHAVVLIPQNAEWTKTYDIVKQIAEVNGNRIKESKILKAAVWLGGKVPGKTGRLINKAFGSHCYSHKVSEYAGLDYQRVMFKESVRRMGGSASKERKKKHILVISQYFYPEQFRVNDICKEWVKRGYRVTVITGIPNYPQGEFYEGYDYKHKRKENWEGIDVVRLAVRPRKTGSFHLLCNYMSFVKSGFEWVQRTDLKADQVFIYEVSPMTQALVGVWYARKKKVPCSLYVTDLWPENVEIVLGIHNRLFLGAIGRMSDYIYKRCDYIFTSSESFIEKIRKRGVSRKKMVYWPQYAEEFYQRKEKKEPLEIPDDGIANLCFAGNLGTAQGLDVLVEAAEILKRKNVLVRFNIIGTGRYQDEFQQHIEEGGVSEYFHFIGQKPAKKIADYFAWCEAALITLSKSEVYSMTIPAKTQSCLACGIPIIASADGEVQKIIKTAQCGFAGDAGDAAALAENIISLLKLCPEEKEKLSVNAIQYYKNNFDKQMLMDKMEEYFT